MSVGKYPRRTSKPQELADGWFALEAGTQSANGKRTKKANKLKDNFFNSSL